MLKRFKPRRSSIMGIDITPLAIQVLQISQVGDDYFIDNFASEPLQPYAIVGNQLRNIDAITACIKKLLVNSCISSKQTVLAVPDSAIITKLVQISSDLTESEIEAAVFLEASKHFIYPLHEINLDFVIQGYSTTYSKKLDVLITACRAEHVNSRVEAVTRAGLVAKAVETESSALERVIPLLVKEFPTEKSKEKIAVITINMLFTQLHVLKEGKVIFTHEEAFGSNQWGETLTQPHDLSYGEVSATKWRSFIEKERNAQVFYTDIIIRQIKRMLQFFFSANSICVIEHLFLAGDMAFLPHLSQRLQEKIRIPATVVNPFKQMHFSQNGFSQSVIENAPSLLLACGLALRECN